MDNTDLEALRQRAENHPNGTVAVPTADLLRLLSHVDELRTDLHNIDAFIQDAELEDEGQSPATWAWNEVIDRLREVPRLAGDDLEVLQAPLIERLDDAEARIIQARNHAQRMVNRYNRQTMVKAQTMIDLLDGTTTEGA